MKFFLIFFGLVLMFSGPMLGEAFQCYWTAYQSVGGGWSSIICESPAGVALRFIAPFEVAGALLCMLGIWLARAPKDNK